MDLPDCNAWLLWSFLGGISALLFYTFLTWPYDTFKKQGIKGPKPLPLLGTTLPFISRSIPELDIENARLYGKVYGGFNGRSPVLMVNEADMAKEILIKQFSGFVNRTVFKSFQQKPMDRMLTVITDDHWRHVRSSLSPTFSSGKLKQMLPTITGCVKHLMGYVDKHLEQPLATKDVLSGYTIDVIAGTAFGLDTSSLEQPDNLFLKNAKAFFSFVTARDLKRLAAVAATLMWPKMGVFLGKFGIRLIDQGPVEYLESVVRKALYGDVSSDKARQDFVHLCREELIDLKNISSDEKRTTDEGVTWTTKGLTEDDIISNAIIFLIAGYDPVSTFLSFFCYAMATNPAVQKKAYEEISQHLQEGDVTYDKLKELCYLEMCMDETLRMYPPVLRIDRKCSATTTVGGVTITAGMTVNVAVVAVHYDADYWEDPFSFVPERFAPEAKSALHPCVYLPFGAGPRNCIGMRMAFLQAKTAIVNLLSKYEICSCSETVKPPLKFAASFGLLSPAEPIKLAFYKRREAS